MCSTADRERFPGREWFDERGTFPRLEKNSYELECVAYNRFLYITYVKITYQKYKIIETNHFDSFNA